MRVKLSSAADAEWRAIDDWVSAIIVVRPSVSVRDASKTKNKTLLRASEARIDVLISRKQHRGSMSTPTGDVRSVINGRGTCG